MPRVPCRIPKDSPSGGPGLSGLDLHGLSCLFPGRDAQLPLKYLGILLIIKGQIELAGDLVSSREAEGANVVRRKMVH